MLFTAAQGRRGFLFLPNKVKPGKKKSANLLHDEWMSFLFIHSRSTVHQSAGLVTLFLHVDIIMLPGEPVSHALTTMQLSPTKNNFFWHKKWTSYYLHYSHRYLCSIKERTTFSFKFCTSRNIWAKKSSNNPDNASCQNDKFRMSKILLSCRRYWWSGRRICSDSLGEPA